MTEKQVNMNYLKGKYTSPTWANMLEECQEWYKEGLKQGKFDKEMEKQQLISFLEDKIKEKNNILEKLEGTGSIRISILQSQLKELQEVLDFVRGGKE